MLRLSRFFQIRACFSNCGRNKSGVWGWRSDKVEDVNGHPCKVFSAQNVELVTKTRTEHLSDVDKKGVDKKGVEDGGAGLLASPLQTLP